MDDLVRLWEKPAGRGKCMIAGWQQWADAGPVSWGLPQYLIDQTGARKIAEIRADGFYLMQLPGTHHLLRPHVRLVDGHREEIRPRRNEFFYSGKEREGLVVFLGEEPHQNEERCA